MDKPQGEFKVPIWLSNWTFRDSRNKKYTLYNQVVKGYNKGEIFTNPKIVEIKLKEGVQNKSLFP